MSYKIILPYVITAVAAIGNSANDKAQEPRTDDNDNKNKIENYTDSARIASRDTVPMLDLVSTHELDSMMNSVMDSIIVAQTMPIRVEQNGKSVIYVYNNDRKVVRNGGTRAWRNNNPGNLRYYDFAKANGAIGEAGKFAVFPDEKTGMQALYKLLQTDSYKNLTIAGALKRYAPSTWRAYTNKLTRLTGLSANAKLSSLNATQLDAVAQSIRRLEGWVPGREQQIDTPRYAMARVATQRVR